jgi:hypothetical protein
MPMNIWNPYEDPFSPRRPGFFPTGVTTGAGSLEKIDRALGLTPEQGEELGRRVGVSGDPFARAGQPGKYEQELERRLREAAQPREPFVPRERGKLSKILSVLSGTFLGRDYPGQFHQEGEQRRMAEHYGPFYEQERQMLPSMKLAEIERGRQIAAETAAEREARIKASEALAGRREAPSEYELYKTDPEEYARFKAAGRAEPRVGTSEYEIWKQDPEGYAKWKAAGRAERQGSQATPAQLAMAARRKDQALAALNREREERARLANTPEGFRRGITPMSSEEFWRRAQEIQDAYLAEREALGAPDPNTELHDVRRWPGYSGPQTPQIVWD